MAFSRHAIDNFLADRGINGDDAKSVRERMAMAIDEYEPESDMFSGRKLEYVLGSAERAKDFEDARERNLVRYGR